MKSVFPYLFTFFTLQAVAQSTVTQVIDMSPARYDLGTNLFPNGDGYAVFGYRTAIGMQSEVDLHSDLFLLRLDKEGNELGRHYYGLPDKAELIDEAVVAVGNDGWLLAGWQSKSGSSTQPYLVRVAANGNTLWTKNLAGHSQLIINAITTLPTGGYIAVGKEFNKLMVMRLDENGNIMWLKGYNAGPAEAVYVSESGGNCFVASTKEVLKVRTSDGALSWMKEIETPEYGSPEGIVYAGISDMVSLGNGMFAVTGTITNDEIFSYTTASYTSLWKENGDIVWAKAFGGGATSGLSNGGSNSILYLPNERELLVAGESEKGKDISVRRIDLNGNLLATNNIPTVGLCIHPVLKKHQGKYIVTGGHFHNGMNTFFFRSAGNWLPNDNQKPEDRSTFSEAGFTLSPNPAEAFLTLDFHSTLETEVNFRILSVTGQLMLEQQQQIYMGNNSINFNVGALPSGVYWLSAPESGIPAKMWLKN